MTTVDFIQFIREFGFPGALLTAVFYAVWKWGWWLLIEVIKPVATKAIDSMEHVSTQCTAIASSTNRLCDGLLQVSNKQLDHDKRFDDQDQAITEIQEILSGKSATSLQQRT